jgi:competence protein ComEC
VASIAFGARSEVDKETIQKFTNTGVIHVLAVSGMNVGLVFVILDLLLRFLKSRRLGLLLYTLLLLSGIWFYALITGMSASIMRATLMFSFVLVGRALQRNSNIFNSMAVSAFLLIAWTPSILGDIGFQLSYAAVLSIVVIQPLLYKHCYFKNWIADKIWLLMSVTFAAQFGTLPFTLLYFHQFPVYFWLANLVVIPLVTMILYLSFVVLFLHFISSFFSGLVAFLLDCSIRLVVYTVDFVDSLPHAIIKNLYPSLWQIIVFLLGILMFYYFFKSRRLLLLKGTILAMIVMVTISIVKNYHKLSKVEIVFFNIGGPRMLLLNGGGSILILYDREVKEPERLDYYLKNYLGRWSIHKAGMFALGDSLRLQGKNCSMMGSLLFFEGIRLYLRPSGMVISGSRELAVPAELIWLKDLKSGKYLVTDASSPKIVFFCKALEMEEYNQSKMEQKVQFVDKAIRITFTSKSRGKEIELRCNYFDKSYSRSNPLPCLTISASPDVQSTMVEGLLSP